MIIYKITCKQTNKIYIGQTTKSLDWRFKKHIYDAKNGLKTHFAKALRKYGAESFKAEIIDTASNQKELTEKEYFWINKLNACNPAIGYNECNDSLKSGGNTYKSKTLEELQIIKEKISKANFGKNNGQAKSIKCFNINTKEEYFFDTITACAQFFNIKNRSQIKKRLMGDKHLYKKEWLIAYKNNEYIKDYSLLDRSTIKGIQVKLINLQNNKTYIFTSKRKAAEYLNVDRKAIINAAIINNYKIEF